MTSFFDWFEYRERRSPAIPGELTAEMEDQLRTALPQLRHLGWEDRASVLRKIERAAGSDAAYFLAGEISAADDRWASVAHRVNEDRKAAERSWEKRTFQPEETAR
jgi:hypothetical protein